MDGRKHGQPEKIMPSPSSGGGKKWNHHIPSIWKILLVHHVVILYFHQLAILLQRPQKQCHSYSFLRHENIFFVHYNVFFKAFFKS